MGLSPCRFRAAPRARGAGAIATLTAALGGAVAIVTGIAIADFLNMLEYIPFCVHYYILDSEQRLTVERVSGFSEIKKIKPELF